MLPLPDFQPSAQLCCDWLYSAADEPVIIVRAAGENIVQVNPAAAALMRTAAGSLIGTTLPSNFDAAGEPKIRRCLALARASGSAEAAAIRTSGGETGLGMRVSLIRASSEPYLLVRLRPNISHLPGNGPNGAASVVFDAINASVVGFLVTGSGFHVDFANRAFLEMVGAESQADVCGNSITQWLQLTRSDLAHLRARLSQREAATLLTTQLRCAYNAPHRVEVCAVPVPEGRGGSWGFIVRNPPPLN